MSSSGPITAADKTLLKQSLIETAFGVGSWGISTTMFFMAVYVLCKQGILVSRTRQVLLGVSSFMYIGVCVAEIVYILQFFTIIDDLGGPPTLENVQAPSARYYLYLIFTRINFLLSDGVVCWRAWVLYQDTKIVQMLLTLCMIGNFVAVTTASGMTTNALLHMNNAESTTVIFNLVYYIPLLFTNLVATSLIGYKFWIYRREIKIHIISEERGSSGVNNVLTLLTESGLLYCFFWVLAMISSVSIMGELGAEILECLQPQISVIYLMIVIIVSSSQNSAALNSLISRDGQEKSKLAFAEPPISRSYY